MKKNYVTENLRKYEERHDDDGEIPRILWGNREREDEVDPSLEGKTIPAGDADRDQVFQANHSIFKALKDIHGETEARKIINGTE